MTCLFARLVICYSVSGWKCREQNQYLKALAFGKTKELIHVDMCAKMKEAGLADLFPVVCWPETRAVSITWKWLAVCVHWCIVAGR